MGASIGPRGGRRNSWAACPASLPVRPGPPVHRPAGRLPGRVAGGAAGRPGPPVYKRPAGRRPVHRGSDGRQPRASPVVLARRLACSGNRNRRGPGLLPGPITPPYLGIPVLPVQYGRCWVLGCCLGGPGRRGGRGPATSRLIRLGSPTTGLPAGVCWSPPVAWRLGILGVIRVRLPQAVRQTAGGHKRSNAFTGAAGFSLLLRAVSRLKPLVTAMCLGDRRLRRPCSTPTMSTGGGLRRRRRDPRGNLALGPGRRPVRLRDGGPAAAMLGAAMQGPRWPSLALVPGN